MNDDERFDARLRELLADPGPDDAAFVARTMATVASARARARRRTTTLVATAMLAAVLALAATGPSLLHPVVLAAALLLTTLCALAWLFTDAPLGE